MRIEFGTFCPLLKKDCMGPKCSWCVKVSGTDMNSGQAVDEYGCAMAWLPHLLIENSGQQRQTGAAVESFRNEMVKANETAQKIALAQLTVERRREATLRLPPDGPVKIIGSN